MTEQELIDGPKIRLSENDKRVLAAFPGGDFPYVAFAFLSEETGLSKPEVRIVCRRLARAGLAEFRSGLWTDEGTPFGAGYAITTLGSACLEAALKARQKDRRP